MAKKNLTQSTVATNNIQNQQDQVKDQATLLKKAFDQYGIDFNSFFNTVFISELANETLNNSGSNTIGHKSSSIVANNVGDALEENRVAIDNLETADTQSVKLTGNQTISGVKTFNTLPQSSLTPTLDNHLVRKKYVDDLAPLNIPDASIKDVKLSNDPGQTKDKVNKLENVLYAIDSKNSIYRGKFLGTQYTLQQQSEVANGTFNDMFIGDYWTISGINYRIAAFNYYKGTGDTELLTNHLVIVPDTSLYDYAMNPTDTTAGGYLGSDMYANGLTSAKNTVNLAFQNRVLSHRRFLSNAILGNEASAGAWVNSTVELLNECLTYGSVINGKSTFGVYNIGSEKTQLPLFSLNPKLLNTRESYWLRDVSSSIWFCHMFFQGTANTFKASQQFGVRPVFSIY